MLWLPSCILLQVPIACVCCRVWDYPACRQVAALSSGYHAVQASYLYLHMLPDDVNILRDVAVTPDGRGCMTVGFDRAVRYAAGCTAGLHNPLGPATSEKPPCCSRHR